MGSKGWNGIGWRVWKSHEEQFWPDHEAGPADHGLDYLWDGQGGTTWGLEQPHNITELEIFSYAYSSPAILNALLKPTSAASK